MSTEATGSSQASYGQNQSFFNASETEKMDKQVRKLNYRQIKYRLDCAAARLRIDELKEVAEKIIQYHTENPELSPQFFQRGWKSARDHAQMSTNDSRQYDALSFIQDALKRIHSKEALFHLKHDLKAWFCIKELSEKIETVYQNKFNLSPLSSQDYESDWTEVEKWIQENLDPEAQTKVLPFLERYKKRLAEEENPNFDNDDFGWL